MAMKRSIRNLLMVFVLGQFMRYGLATMCSRQHPQSAVCSARFVIKAKLISKDWTAPGEDKTADSPFKQRIVRVEVRKVYKGSSIVNATKYSQVNILYTSAQIDLVVGKMYVLTGFNFGPVMIMGLCNWHSLWSNLSTEQRIGVDLGFYFLSCKCPIKECNNWRCKNQIRCPMNGSDENCRSTSQICMGWKGRCQWISPGSGVSC